MNKDQENYVLFDSFGNINIATRPNVFTISKRICSLFLFLFSSFFLNLEAKNIQQIPSSKLKVVVANAPKNNQNKAKARTTKKRVKKATAAPKDTVREIDPANISSPLYEKNQI